MYVYYVYLIKINQSSINQPYIDTIYVCIYMFLLTQGLRPLPTGYEPDIVLLACTGTQFLQVCTAEFTSRVWNLPNTTHSVVLHLLSDDLPIFDELCRRSLTFIYKYLSSRLVRFVSRYGVTFARHKSTIGSNFHFCVSLFKFGKSAF